MSRKISTGAIPLEMRQEARWVVWRTEERNGKRTKVPYRADAPHARASSTDRATWTSFEKVLEAAEHADGIGFVLGDDWVGVDLDHVLDPESGEVVASWAKEWIEGLGHSYIERSPSGEGLHIIGRGTMPRGRNRRKMDDGAREIEIYDGGRYFTVTGEGLNGSAVAEITEDLARLHAWYVADPDREAHKAIAEPKPVDLGDAELLERARKAKNGTRFAAVYDCGDISSFGNDHSAADLWLCGRLLFWTGGDRNRTERLFSGSALGERPKWRERDDYRARTLNKALGEPGEAYDPTRREPSPASEPPPATEDQTDELFVNWSDFWRKDRTEPEWLLEPIIARGRGHALYAPHKVGKSLLILWCALQLIEAGHVVIYLDYEMGEDDLYERLEDMGHGPESDLSRLRYALLPSLPPLDRPEGGGTLCEIVDRVQAENPGRHVAVVIDTISRAAVGEEDSNDTFRDFYRHTGLGLKQRGVTWVRLDHAGKDPTRGQRGASGKGDDVDVIWLLKGTEAGYELRRDAARMGWVPERVPLAKETEPTLRFLPTAPKWPVGTHDAATHLDRLGVPLDTRLNDAQEALKRAEKGCRRAVVSAAVRWRKERAAASSESGREPRPEPPPVEVPGTATGTEGNDPRSHGQEPPSEPPEPTHEGPSGTMGVPYTGTPGPGPASDLAEDQAGQDPDEDIPREFRSRNGGGS